MDVLSVSVLPTALLSCTPCFKNGGGAGSSSMSLLAQRVMGCKAWLEEEGKAFPTPLQALCVCWMLESERSHHKERLGKVLSLLNQCFKVYVLIL